jgi:hypothetical protein
VGLVLWGTSARAEVPPQLGVVVMLKVLTYDVGFQDRSNGDFVVCVPTSDQNADLSAAFGAIGPVGTTMLAGRKVRLRPMPVDAAATLGEQKASALLLLPGLSPKQVHAWSQAAAQLKLYSLSLVPADAQESVLLSVEESDGKPRPVLNKKLAGALGANFPPSMLRLARVVQ